MPEQGDGRRRGQQHGQGVGTGVLAVVEEKRVHRDQQPDRQARLPTAPTAGAPRRPGPRWPRSRRREAAGPGPAVAQVAPGVQQQVVEPGVGVVVGQHRQDAQHRPGGDRHADRLVPPQRLGPDVAGHDQGRDQGGDQDAAGHHGTRRCPHGRRRVRGCGGRGERPGPGRGGHRRSAAAAVAPLPWQVRAGSRPRGRSSWTAVTVPGVGAHGQELADPRRRRAAGRRSPLRWVGGPRRHLPGPVAEQLAEVGGPVDQRLELAEQDAGDQHVLPPPPAPPPEVGHQPAARRTGPGRGRRRSRTTP